MAVPFVLRPSFLHLHPTTDDDILFALRAKHKAMPSSAVRRGPQQECQGRFTKLGGEGIVSPPRVAALCGCGDTTRWCRGGPKAGVSKGRQQREMQEAGGASVPWAPSAISKWQMLQSRSGNCGSGWTWPLRGIEAGSALYGLVIGPDGLGLERPPEGAQASNAQKQPYQPPNSISPFCKKSLKYSPAL